MLDMELGGSSTSAQALDRDSRPQPGLHNNASSEPLSGRSLSIDELRLQVVDSLRTGMSLDDDIYDEAGILLLAAGSLITRRFLMLLQNRGITRVQLCPPGQQPIEVDASSEDVTIATPERTALPRPIIEVVVPENYHTPQSEELDEQLASELQREVAYHPVRGWRRPHLSIEDLKGQARRGVERHAATSGAVADLCDVLQIGKAVSATALRNTITQFVDMAAQDFDLLPTIVALQESNDEYLYDHCVNVSLVSMAVASQLGLDRESITVIGLGGMLQDVGMLKVPISIRSANEELSDAEWREIQRHPLYTLEMLESLRGLPHAVKFIAYQAHERIDGTGYPRKRRQRQVHEFAKIVSLADIYSAMTRPRPYRPAHTPYEAAKKILMDTTNGKFDVELVRVFLDTVALFPVGSRVGLSNGCDARVLRANPGLAARPLLEEITSDGHPTGHIIDLAEDDSLKVVRAY